MIEIEVIGADALSAFLGRAPKVMMTAVANHIYNNECVPLAEAIRHTGSTFPGSARLAAQTVAARPIRNGGEVVAPVGGGRGARVLMGSEFGGQRRPKRAYINHSRFGRAFLTRRRTTMQFPPFLGTRGYWFFPTVRVKLKGLRARVGDVAARAASRA